ncbi:MAG: WecB/TagA/CpsF family glycosyltransferase [Sulfurovaceae bacterium]
MKQYRVLNTPCFQVQTNEDLKQKIKTMIESGTGGYTVAINAEKIMMYQKDTIMREIIDRASLPIPDGSGAILGLKFLHGVSSIKVNMPKTALETADENGYRIFILGSSEEVNKKAVETIESQYSNIIVAGRMNGYFDNENSVQEAFITTSPNIVMIALGSPKQEILASKLLKSVPNILFVGCGGALDVLAGKVKRAPRFFQDNHLEWFYRLIQSPSRIKRQKILPIYLIKLITETIQTRLYKSKRINS